MINLKNEMLRTATSYLNIDKTVKNWLVDYYNSNCIQYVKKSRKYKMKYSDNWCAMFMSLCAHKVGILDFPFEVSVEQMMKLAKLKGTFYTDKAKIKEGDLVIYNWDGNGIVDHVGIVYIITLDVLGVVEGNYRNTVGIRSIEKGSKFITGYIKL